MLQSTKWCASKAASVQDILSHRMLCLHVNKCQERRLETCALTQLLFVQDTKEEQRAKRRRLLSATATARIKRGMIRYLQVDLPYSKYVAYFHA